MDLGIETYEQGGEIVVAPEGEIDIYTAPTLRDALRDVMQQGPRLVLVDLRNVDFIDSTGLGVLLGALRKQRAASAELELIIDSSQSSIHKLLRITELDNIFSVRSEYPAKN